MQTQNSTAAVPTKSRGTSKTRVRPPAKPRQEAACWKACIWLDNARGERVYYDLTASETRWLRRLASAYGLDLEAFVKAFYDGTLAKPYYGREQNSKGRRDPALVASLTVKCSDPALWQQLEEAGRWGGWRKRGDAQSFCADVILGELEFCNEELLLDPRTGKVLAQKDDVVKLGLRTNDAGEPAPGARGVIFRTDKEAEAHCQIHRAYDRRAREAIAALKSPATALDVARGVEDFFQASPETPRDSYTEGAITIMVLERLTYSKAASEEVDRAVADCFQTHSEPSPR